MAKEKDQTQEKLDEPETDAGAIATAELDEDGPKNEAVAIEHSKKFDELIGDEDLGDEDIPSGDDAAGKKAKDDDADDDDEPAADSGAADAKADDKGGQAKAEAKISEDLRKRATDLGMIPEEIDEYGSDAELAKTVAIFEKIAGEDDGATEQAPRAQAPAAQESKKDSEKKTGAEKAFELKFKNEDEIDPEILAGMKALHQQNEDLRRQVAEQGAQVNGLLDGIKAERQKEVISRFDERIEKLGDDYLDTFGKGKTLDISRRSLHRQNRDKIRTHMYALAKGLHEAGQPIPEEGRLFEMAMHNVFSQKVKSVEALQLSKKARTRAKQAIGRGAARKTGDLTAYQKAVENSRKLDEKIDESET